MKMSVSIKKGTFLILFLTYASISSWGQVSFDQEFAVAETYIEAEKNKALEKVIARIEKTKEKGNEISTAKLNYLKGVAFLNKEELTKAIQLLEESIAFGEKENITSLFLTNAYIMRGHCSTDLEKYDDALSYYEKALTIAKKNNQKETKLADIYYLLGLNARERNLLITANSFFKKGVAILKKVYQSEHPSLLKFYEELSINHKAIGNYDLGIKYLQNKLEILNKDTIANKAEIIAHHLSVGKFYRIIANHHKAITYYEKALDFTKRWDADNIEHEAMLHYYIGDAHHFLAQYEQAFAKFEIAKLVNPKDNFFKYEIHRRKGQQESSENNHKKAWNHFQIALNGLESDNNSYEYDIMLCYVSIIDHLVLEVKDYNKALLYIEKAEAIGSFQFYFQFYANMAKAICYLNLGNFKKSTMYFAEAKSVIKGKLSKEKVGLQPLNNRVYLNYWMAENLFSQGKTETNIALIHKADKLLARNIDLINYLLSKYQEQSAKESLTTNYYEVFEKSIAVKHYLFQLTQNTTYLSDAFSISEQSKNLTLFETINTNKAFSTAGIPPSLKEKENRLKSNITYLETMRYEENEQLEKNDKLISQLNNDIFDLKQEYEGLISKIEKDYPRYQQLKFKSSTSTVEDIQKNLISENQTLIEYTLTDSILYVYLINQDTFKAYSLRQNKKELAEKINRFRSSIYSYRSLSNLTFASRNDSLIAVTNQLGFELYEGLIKPLEEALTSKVIIIPDDNLGYLPFDALLKKLPQNGNKLAVHYLLEDYYISYAHSAKWLKELGGNTTTDFKENFVGIAPLFQETAENIDGIAAITGFREGLNPLKYNEEEVVNIKNSIGGKIITGISATRKAFIKYVQQGQVLHLATHGKSNDEQGDYSYLAFAEPTETTGNQFLYVKDLFNLKIPADLVVLSACETGLGEIKKGEGIVGIGKGFSYAGAKSMVTTLWRVSDNATANFMPLFYNNLKAGQAKDEALWNAKRQFIEKYRNAAHPFFWSGYVAYGNMAPIKFQHVNWSISLLLSLLLTSIVVFFVARYLVRK